jgi:cytochrome b subunit of formate dehydrogenase
MMPSLHTESPFTVSRYSACNDCHGLHGIVALGDPKSLTNRKFHTMVCLKCHADKEMMKRNDVMTVAVPTYFDSYHGKNYRLGFPQRVAGCADCHTAHSVLPASNPDSSVNPRHLVETCSQCHSHVTPLFTRFYPHADERDPEHYPVLYWTYTVMNGLLIGVFTVFGLHTLLWLFRGFVENREKKIALVRGRYRVIPEGHRIYRRFRRIHIFMHLLVITSFLGLALTGLPLYFSDRQWAKIMMDYYGGPANSGFIHRICAGITFFYFISAVLMSLHFLFIRRDVKGGWMRRLFGPDSLFFNRRDFRDLAGMLKWFLFLGSKPQFERWTYWEKFDFFAVFWGVFAIGGTGLLLWFPTFFDTFLPGWMFNVATIIHSDEALLATGFIFMIHFFNTHGRPEKFPMDFVIFNGEIIKEDFVNERGDYWKRLEKEGMAECIVKPKPSRALYDFIFKGFGFLALLTGMILLLLMAYAFLVHYR